MKAISIYIFIMVVICSTLKLSAQSFNNNDADTSQSLAGKETNNNEHAKNFIKINVAPIIFKSYSLEYERVLNKKVSFLFTLKAMPENSLPFKDVLINEFGEDEFDRNAIENFRLGSFSLTPQIRFYLSKKGYGRGFYIAPFYSYTSFLIKKLPSQFTSSSNVLVNIDNSGKFSTNTGGILLGAQWMLGKRLSLDWSIVGPHYGSGRGNLIGMAERDLTLDEQNELKELWENSSIPLIVKKCVCKRKGDRHKT